MKFCVVAMLWFSPGQHSGGAVTSCCLLRGQGRAVQSCMRDSMFREPCAASHGALCHTQSSLQPLTGCHASEPCNLAGVDCLAVQGPAVHGGVTAACLPITGLRCGWALRDGSSPACYCCWACVAAGNVAQPSRSGLQVVIR